MKYLVVGIMAGVVMSGSVVAGGQEAMSGTSQGRVLDNVYLEAGLGYAGTNWQNTIGTSTTGMSFTYTSNANGGFMWGGSLGYNVRDWLAVELGGWQLPATDMGITVSGADLSGSLKTHVFYLAGKMTHAINDQFCLFGKMGVNYEYTKADGLSVSGEGIVSNHNYGPFFAGGLAYHINDHMALNAQFARTAGHSHHEDSQYTPDANVSMLSVQYTL